MRSGRVSARYEAGSQIVQAGLTYVVMGCAESLPTCGFSETERLGRRCALFTMFNGFRLLLFLVKAKRDEYPAFACGCDLRHERCTCQELQPARASGPLGRANNAQ